MTDTTGHTPRADLVRLARSLRVDALVYVPATTRPEPPVRLIAGPALDGAERAGLAWLSSARPRPNSHAADADGYVLVPLRSAAVGLLGVVVATSSDVTQWSDDERRSLRRLVEAHAGAIDARATRAGSSPDAGEDFATDLRTAVAHDELHLAYQPEIDLPTGEVVAVEALVRWDHPRMGELGPEWFISLAERSDLIQLVGNWVLEHAIAALARWNAEFPGLNLILRVNVSPVQLSDADITIPISAALERHGVPGRQLCVELTENAPLGDVADVAQAIARLKQLGVSSAIDDLATGYSALSHLRTLPVDFVKIDRSLIHGIDTDRRAQTIVVALIGLALNFELGVIAEGVETQAEATTLLALGCTRAQGHHLGRPRDAQAISALLAGQRQDGQLRR